MGLNKVLIDTNICLDVVLNRKPFAVDAAKIVEQAERGSFTGVLAAHSFDTIFYLLNKSIGQKKAYVGLKALRRAFDVADVTQTVIDATLQLRWPDFEDAIHYQVALAASCDAIVTRNKRDFKQASLSVLSPVEFLDQLNQQ